MAIQKLIFCVTILIALLTAACTPVNNTSKGCSDPKVFCVGLVTEVTGSKNTSYELALLSALKQAEDNLGAQTALIRTAEAADYSKNIAYFTDKNYDVIVTAGTSLDKPTFQAAIEHPSIKFIGIDQYLNTAQPIPPNLQTISYPKHYLFGDLVTHATHSEALSPDQAGFLAGVIAAQTTRSQKIGAICLPDRTVLMQLFCEGYRAGATYIRPNLSVTVDYQDIISINLIKLTQEPDEAVNTALKDMLANDVDLVFAVRESQTDTDIVADANKLGIDIIGVDSDKSLSLDEVKKILGSPSPITPILFELLKQAKGGNFTSGPIYLDDIVEYLPFQDFISQLPEDNKKEIERIRIDLLHGALQTNVQVLPYSTPQSTPPPAP